MPNKSESIILVGVIAGVVSVLTSLIPAAGQIIGCLVPIGAGILVVWHYTEKHQVTLKVGGGINLGILTCLLSFGVYLALDVILRAAGVKPGFQEEVIQGIERGGADISQLGGWGEFMMSPAYIFFGIGIGLAISVLLGLLGGLIGSAIFKRGEKDESSGESPNIV